MNEIGLFVSTFGGAGLFIFYLVNKDKTTNKEMMRQLEHQGESLDDLSFLLLDLLDTMIPSYRKKRNVKLLQSRIENRQHERNAHTNQDA